MRRFFFLIILSVFSLGQVLAQEYHFNNHEAAYTLRSSLKDVGSLKINYAQNKHGEICLPGMPETNVPMVPFSRCFYANPLEPKSDAEAAAFCSCAEAESREQNNPVSFKRSGGQVNALNGFRYDPFNKDSKKAYSLLKNMDNKTAFDNDRDSKELKEKFQDFQMKLTRPEESYTYLNDGLYMSSRTLGLEDKAVDKLVNNSCNPDESSERVKAKVQKGFKENKKDAHSHYENARDSFRETLTLDKMNGLSGNCFTAEEFMEFRSFPDEKLLEMLSTSNPAEIGKLLNADTLFSQGEETILDARGESIKKFLQGNPLLALYFNSTPNEKSLQERVAAVNLLQTMAKEAKGMDPKKKLAHFRDYNKKMSHFLSQDNVLDDISVQQNKECMKLEDVKVAEYLDQTPKVYNLETFKNYDKKIFGGSTFCNKNDPLFPISQLTCIKRANLMCHTLHNAEELSRLSRIAPISNRTDTLKGKGFFHLTSNIQQDIRNQADDLGKLMCPSGESHYDFCNSQPAEAQNDCRSNLKSSLKTAERVSHIEGIKNLKTEDAQINILKEMILNKENSVVLDIDKTLDDLKKISSEKSRDSSIQRRVEKEVQKEGSGVAFYGKEKEFRDRISAHQANLDKANKAVAKYIDANPNGFSNSSSSIASNPSNNDSKKNVEVSKTTEDLIKNLNQFVQGQSESSILPSNFSGLPREEQKAVIKQTQDALAGLDNAGSPGAAAARQKVISELEDHVDEESSTLKKLTDSNGKLQDELISGLKSQIQNMKDQIAGLKKDSEKTVISPEPKKELLPGGTTGTYADAGYNRQQYGGSTQGATAGSFGQTGGFPQATGGRLDGLGNSGLGKSSSQTAINDNNAMLEKYKSSPSSSGLEVVGSNAAITFNSKAVVFDEARQKQMVREEIKLESDKFNEVITNEATLKTYLVGLKLGQESIIIVSEKAVAGKASKGTTLHYYVKKDAKGGISISPVNRVKRDDLIRNISSAVNGG